MNHEPIENSKPATELLPPTNTHTTAPDQVRSAIHALKEIQRPLAGDAHEKEAAECLAVENDNHEVSQGAAALGKAGVENLQH